MILEQISIPCDGATILVEDILSGVKVFLRAPDGTQQEIVSVCVEDGKITKCDTGKLRCFSPGMKVPPK